MRITGERVREGECSAKCTIRCKIKSLPLTSADAIARCLVCAILGAGCRCQGVRVTGLSMADNGSAFIAVVLTPVNSSGFVGLSSRVVLLCKNRSISSPSLAPQSSRQTNGCAPLAPRALEPFEQVLERIKRTALCIITHWSKATIKWRRRAGTLMDAARGLVPVTDLSEK